MSYCRLIGFFLVISGVFSSYLHAEEYTLAEGDKIEILVYTGSELEAQRVLTLQKSSVLKHLYLPEKEPLLKLIGLTTVALEKNVADSIRGEYIPNPTVQVNILEYRPFFITGAVNNPGSYPYQPGLTASKAIALAGGLTERADDDDIRVTRQIDGKSNELKISKDSIIKPGDMINVDESVF